MAVRLLSIAESENKTYAVIVLTIVTIYKDNWNLVLKRVTV